MTANRKGAMLGKDDKQRQRETRRARSRATATARRLYGDLFTSDERVSLDEALTAGDLLEEVVLLRVLVRRAVEGGESLENISRALSRLGQLLKVQHVLSGDSARSLDDALSRVLLEVGTEIGL